MKNQLVQYHDKGKLIEVQLTTQFVKPHLYRHFNFKLTNFLDQRVKLNP